MNKKNIAAVIMLVGCVLLTASGIVQNVMNTLGDTIYGGVNGAPTRLAGNTTTGIRFLSQTGTGTASAAPSWQIAPAAGFLTYYLTNTASSVATYLQMTPPPYTPKTTLTFALLATGTDLLKNWATNAGTPNQTFIPAGEYEFHIHALRTGGGNVGLFAQIWEVSATGVDIGMIGVTETTANLTGVEVEYRVLFVDPNVYTFVSPASRIVARVFAVVSGSLPTVQLFVGDEADSHLSLPSNTIDASNFVPYTGATQNVDLGSHSITVASCTGCGGGGGGFYQTFQNQGSNLTQRATANFTGAGVSCADSGGITVCTISGGGGGGTNATFNLSTVTHTATPSFDLSFGNGFTVVMEESETATVVNQVAGQLASFLICQDGAGNHTFAWPVNVKGGMTVGLTASTCNAQTFLSNGTNLYAVTPGVVNQ